MSSVRRLTAILAADVAGYSRLMGADEEGTHGDGLLVEFASVLDAVRCAVEVQEAMAERNIGVAAESRIELRIGIDLGDVIVEGDDLYGDGVKHRRPDRGSRRCRRSVRLQYGS